MGGAREQVLTAGSGSKGSLSYCGFLVVNEMVKVYISFTLCGTICGANEYANRVELWFNS